MLIVRLACREKPLGLSVLLNDCGVFIWEEVARKGMSSDTEDNEKEQVGRILVIDDDEMTQKNLRRIVEKLGHQVSTYGNPLRALQRLEESPYDVIITISGCPIWMAWNFLTVRSASVPMSKSFSLRGMLPLREPWRLLNKGLSLHGETL